MIISYLSLLSQVSLICDVLGWDQDVCSFLIFSSGGEPFSLIIVLEVPLWQFVLSEELLLWARPSGEKTFQPQVRASVSHFLCFSALITVKHL